MPDGHEDTPAMRVASRRLALALGPALLLGLAVSCGTPPASDATGPTTEPPSPAASEPGAIRTRLDAPSIVDLESATVRDIYDESIVLAEGRHEGPAAVEGSASRPTVELLREFVLQGDFDGDDGEETAVLLSESSGGSGSFLYLALFSWRGDEPHNLGTTLIGDRPQILSLTMDGRHIVVRLVQSGPDDAACCPTQLATRVWAFENGILGETNTKIDGVLSPALIAESGWILTHFDLGKAVPESPQISLALDGDQLSGFGGCNRYFGPLKETTTGRINVGPIAATKMACVGPEMQLEVEYLRRLNRAESYGFWQGSLALTWHDGDEHGLLRFRRDN